jgi:hypothetical protein
VIAQVLIFLPLLEGIAVLDGGTERERCAGAGDAERARAIDRNLLKMTGGRVNGAMSLKKKIIQERFCMAECLPE